MVNQYLIPGAQVLIGLAACLVAAFAPMVIVDHVNWRRRLQGVPEVDPSYIKGALIGLGLGLVIGVITPFYLGATRWWLLSLRFLGGALFFSLGVGHLASIEWSILGAGIGQLGFALFVHFALVNPLAAKGTNPLLFKFIALAALGYAVILIAIDVSAPAFLRHSHLRGIGKAVVAWLSAILVVLEFFNLIFGFVKLFRR
jgi:hypothetical protein